MEASCWGRLLGVPMFHNARRSCCQKQVIRRRPELVFRVDVSVGVVC